MASRGLLTLGSLVHHELDNGACACACCCCSHDRLLATLWIAAQQAPLSMRFSRQQYWSGLPCPPPGDLPHPGIEPVSPAGGFFTIWARGGSPYGTWEDVNKCPLFFHKIYSRQQEPWVFKRYLSCKEMKLQSFPYLALIFTINFSFHCITKGEHGERGDEGKKGDKGEIGDPGPQGEQARSDF